MPLHMHLHALRACFPRPEFTRDLVTYDLITPMAARRVFDRLYLPATLRWELQRIEMLKPIERMWEPVADRNGDHRVLALSDVAYRISAALLDTTGVDRSSDHAAAFAHRLASVERGLPLELGFHHVAAHVTTAPPRPTRRRTGRLRDLGWMPFDTGEEDGAALFFHAVAVDGVIDLTGLGPASLAM